MYTNDSPILHAILAMDSYNRGYDAAVVLSTSQIGNATVDVDSSVLGSTIDVYGEIHNADEFHSFYAVSYNLQHEDGSQQKIISYRGTDASQDISNGWTLGSGDEEALQGRMAIAFYKYVKGEGNLLSQNEITLTGHSLGGGLAGFVGGIYDQKAIIFDHMPYQKALLDIAQRIYEGDTELENALYGSEEFSHSITDVSKHSAFSMQGEVLSYVRNLILNDTNETVLSFDPSIDLIEDSELDITIPPIFKKASVWLEIAELILENVVVPTVNIANETIARHSQSSLVINLSFTRQGTDISYKNADPHFWPVLYDHEFAQTIGADKLVGKNTDNGQYADNMRTVLAYSALEEDEGLVFGNTGVRALYNDANDFGRILTNVPVESSNLSSQIKAYITDISKVFVHYATGLALDEVASADNPDVVKGVLSAPTNEALIIDFRDETWNVFGEEGSADRKTASIDVTRSPLIEQIVINSGYIDVIWQIMEVEWGVAADARAFNRVIFGAKEDTVNFSYSGTFEDSEQATLYVGGSGADIVRGSYDRNLFLGGDGANEFIGGYESDIIIGGKDRDILCGGDGVDYIFGGDGNDDLYGDDGQDVLIGGAGTDNLYGGYGNDIFIASLEEISTGGDNFFGGGPGTRKNLDGTDTISLYSIQEQGVIVNLANNPRFDSIENIVGTSHADIIYGGDEDNILAGMGGSDTFYASKGDDTYHGGFDSQDIRANWHVDHLPTINGANDTVNYSTLSGAAFEITVIDEEEGIYWVDKYYGGTLFSGAYDRDTLYSIKNLNGAGQLYRIADEAGGYNVEGDEQNNTLSAADLYTASTISGKDGDDVISGSHQNDILNGGGDNDYLTGGRGSDTYIWNVGDGDDIINDYGAVGDYDTLEFGSDITPDDITFERGVVSNKITLKIGSGEDGGSIELWGQSGAGGIDYVSFADGTIWDMQGKVVPITGTSGHDRIWGTSNGVYREGVSINDEINSGNGNDRVYAGSGDDLVKGGEGDDILNGDYGHDILYGEEGNDALYGSYGDDMLYGGAGSDKLYGGANADTFVFEYGKAFDGIDTIYDFKLSDGDKLDISEIISYEEGDDILDFVKFTEVSGTSYLEVDSIGSTDVFSNIAKLNGVTGLDDINELVNLGHLIVV